MRTAIQLIAIAVTWTGFVLSARAFISYGTWESPGWVWNPRRWFSQDRLLRVFQPPGIPLYRWGTAFFIVGMAAQLVLNWTGR